VDCCCWSVCRLLELEVGFGLALEVALALALALALADGCLSLCWRMARCTFVSHPGGRGGSKGWNGMFFELLSWLLLS